MKYFLIVVISIGIPFFVYGQANLDSLIDVGNELYYDGKKEKALKIWKDILSSCSDTSSTYGTTLRNIQWYYIEEDNEKMLLEYYRKVMSSRLNDRDRNNKLGEPFKNYRYHSTMNIASFYAKKKEFEKALKFVNIADNDIVYETTTLTGFIFKKVDLAFWKSRLYNDMGKKDSALHVLIKRSLEYDYEDMYTKWSTVSHSKDEKELADEILKRFPTKDSVKYFLDDMKVAFENLNFQVGEQTKITLLIQKMKFEIIVHSQMNSKQACKEYLEDSFLYKYLIRINQQN